MEDVNIGAIAVGLVPLLLAALAGIGWLFKSEREKRHALEERLNTRQSEMYDRMIKQFTEIFYKPKGKERTQAEIHKIVEELNAFTRNCLLFASDEVLRAHINFTLDSKVPATDTGDGRAFVMNKLNLLGQLVTVMRRDLGHHKSTVSGDDLARLFINDYADFFKKAD